MFYEPRFEDKLDANPKLLGFENGVYDLDNDEFREGRPEDYVSLSAGINYIEYDVDNPYIEEIDDFMREGVGERQCEELCVDTVCEYHGPLINVMKRFTKYGRGRDVIHMIPRY